MTVYDLTGSQARILDRVRDVPRRFTGVGTRPIEALERLGLVTVDWAADLDVTKSRLRARTLVIITGAGRAHPGLSLRDHVADGHAGGLRRLAGNPATMPLSTLARWHADQHHRHTPRSHHHGPNRGAGDRPPGWRTGLDVTRLDPAARELRRPT